MLCGYLLCYAFLWMKKLHWAHQFPSVHCLGTHFDAHCCEWNLSRTIPAFLSTGTAYNLYLNLVPAQTWHVTFALNNNTDPSTFCSCSVGFLDPGFSALGFLFLSLFLPSFFFSFWVTWGLFLIYQVTDANQRQSLLLSYMLSLLCAWFSIFLVKLCHRCHDTVQKSKSIKSHSQKLPKTFASKHFCIVMTGAGNGGITVCYCLLEISTDFTEDYCEPGSLWNSKQPVWSSTLMGGLGYIWAGKWVIM